MPRIRGISLRCLQCHSLLRITYAHASCPAGRITIVRPRGASKERCQTCDDTVVDTVMAGEVSREIGIVTAYAVTEEVSHG